MKENIKFEARFKKIDIFNRTLHLILCPKNGLEAASSLYEIKEGQRMRISVSLLDD